MSSPFVLCIDGNIGAGKSSLMQRLADRYACFPEPVAEWTLLSSFYQNPSLYAFPFQLQVSLSQFKQRLNFPPDGLVLVERCPWTSRHVFAPLVLDDAELDLYDRLHRRLSFDVDAFLFLKIDPEVAYRRIRHRSPVDSRISLNHLRRLHDRYASELTGGSATVWTVDAGQSLEAVERDALRKIASLFPDGSKRSSRPTPPRPADAPDSPKGRTSGTP